MGNNIFKGIDKGWNEGCLNIGCTGWLIVLHKQVVIDKFLIIQGTATTIVRNQLVHYMPLCNVLSTQLIKLS